MKQYKVIQQNYTNDIGTVHSGYPAGTIVQAIPMEKLDPIDRILAQLGHAIFAAPLEETPFSIVDSNTGETYSDTSTRPQGYLPQMLEELPECAVHTTKL